MLTIFSCPKAFEGHIGTIQYNAILSWAHLNPPPQIILIGNESGVAEVCQEHNFTHVPYLEYTEWGTPYVDSLFALGQTHASHSLVGYVNADIILMQTFVQAVNEVKKQLNLPFLVVGRRQEIRLAEKIDFNLDWAGTMSALMEKEKRIWPPYAIDYFVFPAGLYSQLPPFALGRMRWDNWLIYHAHSQSIPIVDVTPVNQVLHQSHDCGPIKREGYAKADNPESSYNETLIERWPLRMYTTWDSNFTLTAKGLKKTHWLKRLDARWERMGSYLSFRLKALPLIKIPVSFASRLIRSVIEFVRVRTLL